MIAELEEKKNSLESRIKEIESAKEALKSLEKDLGEKREERASLTEKIKGCIKIIEAKTEDKTLTDSQKEKIVEKLEFSTKKEAEDEIVALEKRKSEIDGDIETITQRLNQARENYATAKALLASKKEELDKSKEVDLSTIEENKQQLIASKTALTNKKEQAITRIDTNTQSLKDITEKYQVFLKVESEYVMLSGLDDTFGGKAMGEGKIKLETYILTHYFDRVIDMANVRFFTMSSGQYRLVRSTEAERQGQGGLELNVIDYYTGAERSVKSLSGGESFKASLSLALGLSDLIQSDAGGIELDTMFVDEGFGSLDTESIDVAVRALIGLGDGTRLVGIVSHRPELLASIDRQIQVKKDKKSGSTARIVL